MISYICYMSNFEKKNANIFFLMMKQLSTDSWCVIRYRTVEKISIEIWKYITVSSSCGIYRLELNFLIFEVGYLCFFKNCHICIYRYGTILQHEWILLVKIVVFKENWKVWNFQINVCDFKKENYRHTGNMSFFWKFVYISRDKFSTVSYIATGVWFVLFSNFLSNLVHFYSM